MKIMNGKVIKFIQKFKDPFSEYMEYSFMTGNCYWFAKILTDQFKGGIYFNPSLIHFAACIENKLYDINGVVKSSEEWLPWPVFMEAQPVIADQIIKQCITLENKKEIR